jgi:predicted O-methyltransferase YrrM
VVASRYELLELLPKGGICAEVGTQTGQFAAEIIRRTAPEMLHVIDHDYSRFQQALFVGTGLSDRIKLYKGDSSTVLASFPDQFFDWIYVDGDHQYAGVRKDLAQAIRKVKPRGLIVRNDYTPWSPIEAHEYGVMRAVNELCLQDGWEFVYLGLSGLGYHDVCLRRLPGT